MRWIIAHLIGAAYVAGGPGGASIGLAKLNGERPPLNPNPEWVDVVLYPYGELVESIGAWLTMTGWVASKLVPSRFVQTRPLSRLLHSARSCR